MVVSIEHVFAQIQRWTSSRLVDSSDAELLERFVRRRDEAAFTALVAQHGAMVLRSCRRVLGDVQEAEDAFQATFLILARKAHRLRRPEALPGWLHSVARRVALKARGKSAVHFSQTPLPETLSDPRSDPLAQLTARELLTVLDEEVQRLPSAQRSAVVLCCLEGRTQEEAARILGWTAGSLKGHLERGRKRLHARLTRRGIALPAALAIVAVSRGEPVSALLRQSTVRAALGGVASSPMAAALAENTLKGTFAGKLAGVTALMLTIVLAASAVALVYRTPAATPADDKPPAAPATPNKADAGRVEKRVDRFGDPLPEGALLRLGTIRYRAGAGINHAALSLDGKLLATACDNSGITFFDLATGKPRHLRESFVRYGFDHLGSCLAFSPDGKQLVNVTHGGNLRFWDVATGKRLRIVGHNTEPPASPHRRPLVVIAPPADMPFFTKVWFPPESPNVVAGAEDNFAVFIDPSTGKTRRRFQLAGKLASVASDGKTLAAVGAKRPEVILYDESGKELRRFRHESKIEPVALCQGGKRLVTVNDKGEIKIWNTVTGKEQHTLVGPSAKDWTRGPTVVSIAPDGNTLFAGTRGGDIFRWDLRDGKEQSPLRGHTGGFVTGLFHTPDGRSLISVSWDKMVHRWNLTTGKAEAAGEGYVDHLRVARSPDGQRIAVASYPGRLEFWDARTGKQLGSFALPAKSFSELRFSPDGQRLALACSDARVRLWDIDKERVTRELKLSPSKEPGGDGRSWFEGLAWSPDGRFLVTSLKGDGIRMWEAATGKETWHGARRGAVAFSPDGKTLVSGGWDECLTFQDAATGEVSFVLKEKEKSTIDSITFSPDGRSLATSHHGGVYLRDPKTGKVRKLLQGYMDIVWSISFSPDSKWITSGGCDGMVRVWEVATGVEVLRRQGHEGWVMQAEFGSDGRTVLSASLDLTALLWSIRPGVERGGKRPLEKLWADLAGEPAQAYRALWELADDPKAASDFLRRKIAPVKIDVDERRVRSLLDDLDSDDFSKRESASRALVAMDAAVEGRLRRALADAKSAEVQQRLRDVLEKLKREPTADDLRRMRAVQVMELCGTADALRVLGDWANGTAGIPFTEQARATRQRLANNGQR